MSEKDDTLDYSARMFARSIYRVMIDLRLSEEQRNTYLEKIGDYIIKANKILYNNNGVGKE